MKVQRQFFVILAVACIAGAAAMQSCKRSQDESALFVPGEYAAGIHIEIDDSIAVEKKLGPPDHIAHPPQQSKLWIYFRRGFIVQFGGLITLYHSPLEKDSSVSQVLLLTGRPIERSTMETCLLHTPEGISVQSSATDFVKAYGEPVAIQTKQSRVIDSRFTGTLIYPGMYTTFRDGKPDLITVKRTYKPDSSILQRTITQPIVPGVSIGGITMGMTRDQVLNILGKPNLSYVKINAEFWFYPEYSIKVQFGIPPIEGKPSAQYFDTTRQGHVTGITGVSRSFFDNEVCPVSYVGRTPEGIAVGMPSAVLREKLGEPLQFVSRIDAQRVGKYPYYVYKGIVFFIDPDLETIHHLLVTDETLPLEVNF